MRKKIFTVIIIIVLLAGLSLLLYPTISDYFNTKKQLDTIAQYSKSVSKLDTKIYENIYAQAEKYNQKLAASPSNWKLNKAETAEYESEMNISDTGVIAYIEIPKISCTLPICLGTDASVLQTAIGHIEGSSLPIGGKGTHTVLSGHRGLPSAKLFTDIDELEIGDVFMINVLNKTLTYEVDQTRIVEPDDFSELKIEDDKDLCTLVTCTPYGINTHRLLVRGHRIENKSTNTIVTADANQIEPFTVVIVIMIPFVIAIVLYVLISKKRFNK